MYTPKKGWMRWKKIIQSNLIESDNGDIVYRLGDDLWQRHCLSYSFMTGLSQEQVAIMFATSNFDGAWAHNCVSGESSGLEDYFPDLFWGYGGGRVSNKYLFNEMRNKCSALIDYFEKEESSTYFHVWNW